MDVNINKGRGTRAGDPPHALAMNFCHQDNACGEMTRGKDEWKGNKCLLFLVLWRPDEEKGMGTQRTAGQTYRDGTLSLFHVHK